MWLALYAAALAEDVSPKIINGADASVDDWPQSGALLVDLAGTVGLQCSSSLIAPDVVILAAHCVDPAVVGATAFDGMGWSRQADLSAFQQASTWPDDTVPGADWVFHDAWDINALQTGLALNYDVGLLFLEEAQTDLPLAWLPTAEEAGQISEGAAVSIVGWGMDDAADTTSYGVKHFGDSTVDALADYEFQVGAATDAVRKCHGDSGGPTFLTIDTPASVKQRMIGVTSHTWDETDCMETGGVDTRVDYYLDWIDAEMVSRCEDGSRVWCDIPGILPPPVPESEAELLSDLQLVGCRTTGGAPAVWLVALAVVAVGRRGVGAPLANRPSGGQSSHEVLMPVFEYQCECGKKMDVLVRGNEPATCDAALEASDWCSRGGRLSKLISAPYVAKSSGATFYNSHTGAESAGSDECGHCGNAPGSCESD